MSTLIACLGAGKGTWNEVKSIMSSETWDKIFLITNSFGKEKFTAENAEFIVLDDTQPAPVLAPQIIAGLKGKIPDMEVAVSIASGPGNVHMALIAALLKLGLGMRLVTFSNQKVETL
jgi:hypothetical protein